jgi:hypothetical protein
MENWALSAKPRSDDISHRQIICEHPDTFRGNAVQNRPPRVSTVGQEAARHDLVDPVVFNGRAIGEGQTLETRPIGLTDNAVSMYAGRFPNGITS